MPDTNTYAAQQNAANLRTCITIFSFNNFFITAAFAAFQQTFLLMFTLALDFYM
jgi:hypothetical protein